MASIKRRAGSKYWVACYTLPDGSRKQVSTKTEDEYEARIFASRLEQAAQQARKKSLTRDRALRLVDEIAAMADVHLLAPETVTYFLEQFRLTHRATWSQGTAKKYRVAEQLFLESLGPDAHRSISLIESRQVARWRDEQLANGRAPKTVANDVRYLRRVFRHAVERHLIGGNPFEDLRLPSAAPGRARKRKKPFTWDQFQQLLAATDGEWRLLILLAGYTGQRRSDVARLKWGQVDLFRGTIRFRRQKTRDEYLVPMHPAVRQALQDAMPAHTEPDQPVMPEMAVAPPSTTQSISERFRFEILPRIGIVQPYRKRPPGDNSREVTEYSFHSLRHMLSTELNRAGVSPETRRLIVGHASAQVSAQYTHASLADAARALEMLPG